MSVIKLVRRQKEDELENKARVYEEYCRMELSQVCHEMGGRLIRMI